MASDYDIHKEVYNGLLQQDKELLLLYLAWAYNTGQYMRFWRGPPNPYPDIIVCDIEYLSSIIEKQNIVYHRIVNEMTADARQLIKSLTFEMNEKPYSINLFLFDNILHFDCNVDKQGKIIIKAVEYYIKLFTNEEIDKFLSENTIELSLL